MEEGHVNVPTDLGMADADKMIIKERLATKIREIIKDKKWSQQQASSIIGVPQSKLSGILRGQFRGVSESKMLDCLVRLGRDVEIVVSTACCVGSTGKITVVFE